MSIGVLTGLLVAAAAVDVQFSPDQPLPYSYVDDPLIVAVRAEEDTDARLDFSIRAAQEGAVTEITLGGLTLRAHETQWYAVEGVPPGRGLYIADIRVTAGETVTEKTARYCRIDRPTGPFSLPVVARVPNSNIRLLRALRCIGVDALRLDAAAPDVRAQADLAVSQRFDLVLTLDVATVAAPVQLAARLAESYRDDIARWEVVPAGDAEALAAVARAVRLAGCAAPVAAAVPDTGSLKRLLDQGAGRVVSEAVLVSETPDRRTVSEIVQCAAATGIEGWRVYVANPGRTHDGEAPGPGLIRRILENLACGIGDTGFHADRVYAGEIEETFVYISGLAHRLVGAEFAGALNLGTGAHAPLFRNGDDWLLALWSDGPRDSVALPLGGAADLVLTDALNNPRFLPEPVDGVLTLTIDARPTYLSGVGGPVPGLAARGSARELARAFAENARYRHYLPEACAVLEAVAAQPVGPSSRTNFLDLLRRFPELERRWHAGALPQAVAVTAIADLARLARFLCVVEEDRGTPFLEPLADRLAQCEELQSLYLTSSVGTPRARLRGDWLLEEVRRLLDSVEALAVSGKRIEAGAVAALAEWRARSLEYAAKAGPRSESMEDTFDAGGDAAVDGADKKE